MINITAELLPQLIIAVGILAFVVSVITEVIKGIKVFAKIPTDLVVIILSIAITVTAFIAYTQYASLSITWYLVVASIICGFFVAFIAMYGWSKMNELWTRFNPRNK